MRLLFSLLACLALFPEAVAQTAKPNVVIIIADDLGWNDIGTRNSKIVTPNLVKLAKEGVELQRFYGYPVCSPARAGLLTGVLPRRLGLVNIIMPGQAGITKATPALPAKLKSAGYTTSLIGKWHLGNQNPASAVGFDHFYGFMGGEVDYLKHTDMRGKPDWQRDGKQIEESGYTTYLFADEASKQIRNRDKAKPFFLQVAFNAPHVDLAAPEDLVAKHKTDGLYGAVVEGLDIGIGRILTTLDEQGLRDNTLVIFVSDNGASRRNGSNAPLRGYKSSVDEGGIRTPAIVRWPKRVPAGVKLDQPIAVIDLFPTIAAAANLPLTAELKIDGVNQWPAIAGGKTLPRPPFLVASSDIALFDGDWKLVETNAGQRTLFNLKADISEAKDLLATQPEQAAKLGAQLDTLKKDLPAYSAGSIGKGGAKGGKGKGKK
ncbi:MAG: arylsulfatase [Opitutia bacterium]|nr:MAG: arylsulfatase [Opitutae bacterium]